MDGGPAVGEAGSGVGWELESAAPVDHGTFGAGLGDRRDRAVAERDDLLEVGKDPGVVGGDEHRHAAFGESVDRPEDRLGALAVELRGRLVGDLDVADADVDLPEISNSGDISPTDWGSGLVAVDPADGDIPVRVWIRDESGFCLFCNDVLVDLTPVPDADALHLLINGATGEVRLADEDWVPQGTIATLTGPVDGDLSGTVTVEGDDDGIHRALITVALTVVRQPVPEPAPEPVDP